jgi:hypothetical protein
MYTQQSLDIQHTSSFQELFSLVHLCLTLSLTLTRHNTAEASKIASRASRPQDAFAEAHTGAMAMIKR